MYTGYENPVKMRNLSSTEAGYEILDIEIDRGCGPCNGDLLKSGLSDNIPLYKYQELPTFLHGNPYIVQGYRALLPFSLCCKSLFIWSNETINLWSHLVGFIIFFFLMLWDNTFGIPEMRGSTADHAIITLGLLCFQFCMLCSVGYHMFRCHSERASKRWLAIDMAGISVGLIGIYLPAVHYAFYCLSVWRDVYMMVISVMFVAVLFFQTQSQFYSQASFNSKLLLYCGLVAYGIIPTLHWIRLNGGMDNPVVQIFAPRVTTMYLLGILAFAFYISKFPECCFPGRFDYIGSSHQWWHLIVMVSFYYWHNSGIELLALRVNQPCL